MAEYILRCTSQRMNKMIKCPRCDSKNSQKEHSCLECGLPLRSNKLAQYAANIQMQWNRLEEDNSDLLYEDSQLRVYPSSKTEEHKQTKRIVYYKKERFVLLGFTNIIHKKKAVIHFKLRPEKGILLFYNREHRLSDLFMDVLESIAEAFDWELEDITKTFERHTKLENAVKYH